MSKNKTAKTNDLEIKEITNPDNQNVNHNSKKEALGQNTRR